ncbi:MAG: hypothetical protein ACHQ4H_01165 [Ktedonobacterales bacterium]
MRIRPSLLPLLLLAPLLALGAVASLAVASPTAHAASRIAAHPRDTGALSGVVANGTHGNAPTAGLPVTLRAIVLDKPHDAGTTATDAQGRYAFGGLDTSGMTTYEVYAHFAGGFFITAPVTFASGATQHAALTVFDTTSSDANVRVSSMTVLLSPVNKDQGLLPVGEFFTFVNGGATAMVGNLAPAGGAMPAGLLRFALPADATNLTLGAGFADAPTAQIGTGFAAAATVPPGTSSFAFAFESTYTGTSATLTLNPQYASGQVVVLAPAGYRVSAPGFASKPQVQANGQQLQVFEADGMRAGATPTFTLRALPEAGVDPDLHFGQVLIVGLGLALLLAVLLWLFVTRGALPGSRRMAAATSRRRRAAAGASGTHSAEERARLLKALLGLDDLRASGALPAAAYQRQRATLRDALRVVLAAELAERAEGAEGAEGAEDAGQGAEDAGQDEQGVTVSEVAAQAAPEAGERAGVPHASRDADGQAAKLGAEQATPGASATGGAR